MDDYWREHAEIALAEAGLSATSEQIETIAGVIESAHDFYGQAMGNDVATANWHGAQEREKKDLIKKHEEEMERAEQAAEKRRQQIIDEKVRISWALHDARRENERLRNQ